MSRFNLSFHEDDHFNLEHDNRKRVSKNVDPEKIKENISYAGNIPIQEFYENTFQKSYEEYIEKVRHSKNSGRVKNAPEKYFDYVTSKQIESEEKVKEEMRNGVHRRNRRILEAYTKAAKQIIVQMGNIDDFEDMNSEEQKDVSDRMAQALEEYMNTFQKENPNMKIVNAVIHRDEMSLAPHLHLTYVPVAEQARGQKIANSLSGALKAMGFVPDKKGTPNFQTAQTKWQTKERERMIEIAKRFDLETGYQKGNKGKGQSIAEYRATKQIEREVKYNEKILADQQEEMLQNQVAAEEQRNAYDEVAEDLYKTSSALNSKTEELEQAKKELENIDYVKERLDCTLNRCEEELVNRLAPEEMPVDNYERITRGLGSKKKTYVMVPEDEYAVLDARNSLSRSNVTGIIIDLLEPIRKLVNSLPLPKSLKKVINKLKEKLEQLSVRMHEMEDKNAELKRQTEIADRVLYKKLGLSKEAIDVMKEEAKMEIMYDRDLDDDILR